MTRLDLSVYALVDPQHAGGRELPLLAALLAKNGATLIQLRDKVSSTRAMIDSARAIKAALAGSRVPLVINDRVDVAAAAVADGVHVGQDDMAIADARRLLGPNAIIGLSVKTPEQARAAPLDLLSYVAIGGVFATSSKDNRDPPVGLDGLNRIAGIVRGRVAEYPVCASAGIDAGNAAGVVAAGADGVAVISALSLAADPAAATRALRVVVDEARARR